MQGVLLELIVQLPGSLEQLLATVRLAVHIRSPVTLPRAAVKRRSFYHKISVKLIALDIDFNTQLQNNSITFTLSTVTPALSTLPVLSGGSISIHQHQHPSRRFPQLRRSQSLQLRGGHSSHHYHAQYFPPSSL